MSGSYNSITYTITTIGFSFCSPTDPWVAPGVAVPPFNIYGCQNGATVTIVPKTDSIDIVYFIPQLFVDGRTQSTLTGSDDGYFLCGNVQTVVNTSITIHTDGSVSILGVNSSTTTADSIVFDSKDPLVDLIGSFMASLFADSLYTYIAEFIKEFTEQIIPTLSSFEQTVSMPSTPSGATSGMTAINYEYATGGSTSSLGFNVQYLFDWDDSSTSGWLPVGTISALHNWSTPGTYRVKALARCAEHPIVQSAWSPAQTVIIEAAPEINITSPNGGESWTAGEIHEITWISSGSVGNVDIIYTYDGGSTWQSIVADTPNDGSHLWTVPDTPSGNCYVQVLEHADGVPYDASDAPFTILTVPLPSLELTAPNGWEHWTLGTTKAITWNAINYTGTVRLVLFKNGVRFGNIVANLPASAGSYSWTVGQTYDSGMAPEGSDYRLYLRSTDNTIIDPSDYRLGLIEPAQLEMTSPNGGESWELGTTQNITWNANGYSGTVRLILFQKAAKVGQIAANLPADQGSYAWTVGTHQAGTAPAGILYSIRLLAGDGSQDDFSDGPLTLIESDALVVDHHHTVMNVIPAEWLEQAKRHRLLVLSAQGDDPVTLGLRLLGSKDARLAPVASPNEPGLVAQEGSWLPQGAALDPQEWRWSLEKAILDSQATVAVIRPDEGALLANRLNAEIYLSVVNELSGRLPGVKLACSTVGMDEPNDIPAKFNRQVRESVLRNKGTLLDAADIESWSGGDQQLVKEVPVRHPANRMSQGMESQGNLASQGAAAWWLLARLAGWEE